MRSLLLALPIACVLVSSGLTAADPNPVSWFATVEVVATDKGKPVTGLDKREFQLLVDGRPQPILTFRPVEPPPAPGAWQGKTVMILFDVHAMTSAQAQVAQTAAVKYVESHMRRHDLFAVGVYGRNLQIAQPFTTDVEKVIGAIRRPLQAFGTSKLEKGFSGDEGLQLGKNALMSLRSLCEELSEIRGSKSVMVFSQDFFAPSGEQYSRLVESARRAKVAFYTLITTQASAEARPRNRARTGGATALSTFGRSGRAGLSFSSLVPQQQQQPRGGPPASTPTGPTGSGINDPSLREDVSKADQAAINTDVLQALAKETNGDYVRESNNLTQALDQFDLLISNYYVLGFSVTSPAERLKLEVKTSRKGLRLSYPKSFYLPGLSLANSPATKKLTSALESGAVGTQPTFQVRSVVLKSELDFGEVFFYLPSRVAAEASVMAGFALMDDGARASFQAFRKENQARIGPGFLMLPPGKYRVKLAVADLKGEVSVVEHDVTVPNFPADHMVAGDLLVTAQVAPLPDLIRGVPGWLIEGHPLVFKGYEITPSVENRSSREKGLPLFFQVFNAGGSGELVSDPRLTDETGQTTLLPAVRHVKTADPGINGTVALGFSVPVTNLRPGKYHLTVHTRGTAGKEPATCETDVWLE